MPDAKYVADAYLNSWNEPPGSRELRMAAWAATACYVDPLMHAEGRDGITAMMDAACAGFPDHRFTLTGFPDGHGSYVRFSWSLASGGNPPVARGTDLIKLDADGLIVEVVGFLDEVPQ